MRKLLSILAAITLTVTPVTSVVACGSNKEEENTDSTNTIIKSGSGLNLNADDLLKQASDSILFGAEDTAVHDFMNYFAFQVSKELSDSTSELARKFAEAEQTNSYINDNFINSVKKQYDSARQYATNQWNEAVANAQENGKKWEEDFRKELEKQLNRSFKSYLDAKDVYITSQMMKGTNGTSVIDALLNAIYAIPQDNKVLTSDEIIRDLQGQIMGLNTTIEGIAINLAQAWGSNRKPGLDLISELTKLFQALSKELEKEPTPNFDFFSIFLINFVNATGGKVPSTNEKAKLNEIQWMTKEDFKTDVLGNPRNWAQEIIKRACSTYNTDYDSNGNPTPNYNPIIDGNGEGVRKYREINSFVSLSDSNTLSTNASTKGLFSNAQRYFANQYFAIKKPLAISEFVISPLTSAGSLSTNINNVAYIDKTDTNKADANSLYNFMNIFVNKDNWTSTGSGSDDNTKNMIPGSSDYSWDELMNNNGDVNKWTKQAGDRFTWSTNFGGKVTLNQHTKLLTLDSSSSDYSNLLKYSVYDYITKTSPAEYQSSTAPYDFDEDGSITNKTSGTLSNEQNAVTNWVNSMNRRLSDDHATDNIYQVLNDKQGIISYVDSDGIHLVRIEGYELLRAEKNAQSILSTKGFVDNNQQVINNYQAIESINRNLASSQSDVVKNGIKNQTYDFTSQNQTSYFNYDNLNTSFGNEYLQFLANSSILYAIGVEGTKEKYDLGKEVQTYVSSAIPSASASSTNLWISAWTYLKDILSIETYEELFDLVFPPSDQTYSTFGIKKYATQNTIYEKYRKYIIRNIRTIATEVNFSPQGSLNDGWIVWADSKKKVASGDITNRFKPLNTLNSNSAKVDGANYWEYEKEGTK